VWWQLLILIKTIKHVLWQDSELLHVGDGEDGESAMAKQSEKDGGNLRGGN
jgi:hypothetical protein